MLGSPRGNLAGEGRRRFFYACRDRDDHMNHWLDQLAPIDWMNRRSTWQFFFVYVICTSAGCLLGAGVIDWIATGHANVRLADHLWGCLPADHRHPLHA